MLTWQRRRLRKTSGMVPDNIIEATLADIPRIQAMAEIVFRHTYREILTPQQMEYMMDWMYSTSNLRLQMQEQGHHYLLMTSPQGQDIGYSSYNLEKENSDYWQFHLQKIYVLPNLQGHGLGKLLFKATEQAMQQMSNHHPLRFELNVNRTNRAVTFYEHMGMHCDRQGDFPIGNGFYMNDFIMAKELPAL